MIGVRYVWWFETCHEQVMSVVLSPLKVSTVSCVLFCRDVGAALRRFTLLSVALRWFVPLCDALHLVVGCFTFESFQRKLRYFLSPHPAFFHILKNFPIFCCCCGSKCWCVIFVTPFVTYYGLLCKFQSSNVRVVVPFSKISRENCVIYGYNFGDVWLFPSHFMKHSYNFCGFKGLVCFTSVSFVT